MFKATVISLTAAGAIFLAAQPAANAASLQAGVTQDFSAATVKTTTTVRHGGTVRTRTTVRRTYPAPSYYGYYGPTSYERPYSRPPAVVLGIGGWW